MTLGGRIAQRRYQHQYRYRDINADEKKSNSLHDDQYNNHHAAHEEKMRARKTNLERGLDLIGEGFPPDALPTLSGAGGVTRLDHEACDVAVEFYAVVCACCAVGEEVFC